MQEQSFFKKLTWEVFDLLKVFLICFIGVYLFTNFIAKPIKVEGSSMYPTLEDQEFGITNIFGARFLGIDRFDVVIVHNEQRDEYWVKRVIALPNETVEMKNDMLYINNQPVEESFLNQEYVKEMQKESQFTEDFGPVQLKDDEYWLMGDNRPRSEDSRRHGPFKKQEIVGKDVFVLYPFEKIKYIHNGK